MAESASTAVSAVVTAFNQGTLVKEAVQSLLGQTRVPEEILVIDDGTTDLLSQDVLKELEREKGVQVLRQDNCGVSAARNRGIRAAKSELVLILDGDDKLSADFLEKVVPCFDDPHCLAASSYLKTFGALESVVKPEGGAIDNFLHKNNGPASHVMRKEAALAADLYDESMREGFEDWDFFLSLLESRADAYFAIIKEPLISYCTALSSSNMRSMQKRLKLMGYLMDKHHSAYAAHFKTALLKLEAVSIERLNLACDLMAGGDSAHKAAEAFLSSPSYGDGGMAAAVRLKSLI